MVSQRNQRRAEVFARDRGVCKGCKRDTEKLKETFEFDRAALIAKHGKKDGAKLWKAHVRAYGFTPGISLWVSDHIQPHNLDGPSDLDNLQTLCVPCHNRKTQGEAPKHAKIRRVQKKARGTPPEDKEVRLRRKQPQVKIPGVNAKRLNTLGE